MTMLLFILLLFSFTAYSQEYPVTDTIWLDGSGSKNYNPDSIRWRQVWGDISAELTYKDSIKSKVHFTVPDDYKFELRLVNYCCEGRDTVTIHVLPASVVLLEDDNRFQPERPKYDKLIIQIISLPNRLKISFKSPSRMKINMQLTDVTGRIMNGGHVDIAKGDGGISVPVRLTAGIYFMRFWNEKF